MIIYCLLTENAELDAAFKRVHNVQSPHFGAFRKKNESAHAQTGQYMEIK